MNLKARVFEQYVWDNNEYISFEDEDSKVEASKLRSVFVNFSNQWFIHFKGSSSFKEPSIRIGKVNRV